MARRNLKRDYIKKILTIKAPNGYKFDLANYIGNPAYDYDYPSFYKVIAETDTEITKRRVYYMKYYNGGGEYCAETYTLNKDGDTWQIARNHKSETLEEASRFNINKLLTFCE